VELAVATIIVRTVDTGFLSTKNNLADAVFVFHILPKVKSLFGEATRTNCFQKIGNCDNTVAIQVNLDKNFSQLILGKIDSPILNINPESFLLNSLLAVPLNFFVGFSNGFPLLGNLFPNHLL